MLAGSLTSLMTNLLVEIPLFLIWLAGIAWAIRSWRNHPRVSLIVVVALAIQIVDLLLASATSAMTPSLVLSYGYSVQTLRWIYPMIGAGRSLTSTGAWAAILVAVFGWRPVSAPPV